MKNQIKRYNLYIIVIIGLIYLVTSTVSINRFSQEVLKIQAHDMREALVDLLKTPQWYYIENSSAPNHKQGSC
ncbi:MULTISPECIES: hypothetical protein [unclassified Sphingobacterium]|uniref:hypothetical protein n=1 Tax=unclassified Sphingobacterium TaxID=2609468 RepID=UPI001048115D|nr:MULTISPECIES: hypothetical protein [unclassified Sphingobacterium]MCS3553571.1 presenilin-like A22 family membrane protease [Sphingobacterium sp. JUb21]TCR09221.1 hypothetical protein EDF66_10213 [Sphingobacterium sp. JUb20]